uniref:Uncharacterized protein n=1 Tax=Tanacetum cinerariifolium TaxID=118510 RepID=A0A699ISW1_TANCI|nr:hypothetical protein [Tanacetum cinerariifolium]
MSLKCLQVLKCLMNLTLNLLENELAEATRQVYATHEWIVTESDPEPTRRRPSSIAFRDTSSVSNKISPNPSKKLNGIQTMTAKEKLAANTMQALKAIRKSKTSQSLNEGSSEGTGVSPGVLDESTVIPTTLSEGISVKLGVPDETDDEETDDEFMRGDEYVRDDVDKEMKDAEVTESAKRDEEITNTAKADAEKTEDVKDDNKKAELPP